MRTILVLLLATVALVDTSQAEKSKVSQQGAHRMEIVLERLEAGAWKIIDPTLVLEKNDRIRFKFKANFSGFLYVTNQSTSSTNSLLFPRGDTGSNNRILANKEYMIPASKGAFRVDGPSGYDVVAWMVSPVELGRPEAPELREAPAAPPANMTPRCDDTLFKARGACLDSSAGPQAAKKSDDVVFIRESNASVISSNTPLKSPLVYEFHLAHR